MTIQSADPHTLFYRARPAPVFRYPRMVAVVRRNGQPAESVGEWTFAYWSAHELEMLGARLIATGS